NQGECSYPTGTRRPRGVVATCGRTGPRYGLVSPVPLFSQPGRTAHRVDHGCVRDHRRGGRTSRPQPHTAMAAVARRMPRGTRLGNGEPTRVRADLRITRSRIRGTAGHRPAREQGRVGATRTRPT